MTIRSNAVFLVSTQEFIAFHEGQLFRCLTACQVVPIERNVSVHVVKDHANTEITFINIASARLTCRGGGPRSTYNRCRVCRPRINLLLRRATPSTPMHSPHPPFLPLLITLASSLHVPTLHCHAYTPSSSMRREAVVFFVLRFHRR
jgi:hypothetical protein